MNNTALHSDEKLIKRLRHNDEHALKMLYNRYWKRMFVYAHKIHANVEACEDLVQEIFIDLWERSAEQITIKNLEAYLFTALRYKLANNIRNIKFTSAHESVLEELPSDDSFNEKTDYLHLEAQVLDTMNRLPKKCRKVFYMSRIENYNNHEIAEKLDISVRTVETHISKALRQFRISLVD